MRSLMIAILSLATLPTLALADSKSSFYFGFGGGYSRYYSAGSCYRPYSYYYPRYVVPRVYSPYRYHDYKGDYFRDYAYRRGLYSYDRGNYYGPAVERYHRHARDYPSYHYGHREYYNRGSDFRGRGYDRGGRNR